MVSEFPISPTKTFPLKNQRYETKLTSKLPFVGTTAIEVLAFSQIVVLPEKVN